MASHEHHAPHDHSHESFDPTQRAFAVGVTLNLIFVVVELYFGFTANSLALLADAGHNFSDVIGLLIAWGALVLAKRKPSERFTYGLRSSTIMAALANAMLLLVALMLQHGSKHDINVRGAFLHMLGDAAVSVGVVIAGLGMLWLGWLWLDGAVSILIAAVILWSTWGLFRESINLALHAVPAQIEVGSVRDYLAGLPGVTEVHDLHIWAMSTTEIALTAHLLIPSGYPGDEFLSEISKALEKHFHIDHPTLQIEISSCAVPCRIA